MSLIEKPMISAYIDQFSRVIQSESQAWEKSNLIAFLNSFLAPGELIVTVHVKSPDNSNST